MTETFPWFSARLLFQACESGVPDQGLYEERIVLIQSDAGMDAARKKAQRLAESATDEYQNEAGEDVAWSFKEVLDIVQLDESTIAEGSEVYHHYLSEDEVVKVRQSLKTSSL